MSSIFVIIIIFCLCFCISLSLSFSFSFLSSISFDNQSSLPRLTPHSIEPNCFHVESSASVFDELRISSISMRSRLSDRRHSDNNDASRFAIKIETQPRQDRHCVRLSTAIERCVSFDCSCTASRRRRRRRRCLRLLSIGDTIAARC
jgi:hypothetical protein